MTRPCPSCSFPNEAGEDVPCASCGAMFFMVVDDRPPTADSVKAYRAAIKSLVSTKWGEKS